jgi:hypothetical protein
MFRRVLALMSFAGLVSTAALAQPAAPLLMSTPVSLTGFWSLDAVQGHVDGILKRAAVSKRLIDAALAQPPLPLVPSTPVSRR